VSDIAHKTLTLRAKPRLPKRPRYKGTRKARLWRLRATAIAMSLALGTATSGCSLSYKLDSFTGKDSENAPLTTNSVPGSHASSPGTDSVMPPESDLAYARSAATLVVTRIDKGASVPWSNPATGARGTVTPLADAYTQDGVQCRDFLASYIRDGSESWLQGDACRARQGKWTVRALRPLKRS
jgi:17 kDa outer membrane surface antigen